MSFEEIKKQYIKCNPHYMIREPKGKNAQQPLNQTSILEALYEEFFPAANSEQAIQIQQQRFMQSLNLYTAVATSQSPQNEQLCQFCPKDKQQPTLYSCTCGTRFCSMQCQKIHRSNGDCQGSGGKE